MKPLLLPALQLAGVAHFCILIASSMVPRVLDWNGELAKLPRMLRQLFWVYGVFIVLTIAGFGALTLVCSHELADGGLLARAFCLFVSLFWLVRLGVQFVFEAKPYLTNAWLRFGYNVLSVTFVFLALVYGVAACLPR